MTNKDIKNTQKNAKKASKVIEKIGTTLIVVIFIFVLIVCLGLLVQIFSGKKPSFFGYRFYYILTDSMEPDYLVGDVILSKLTETDQSKKELKVGDIITFKSSRLAGQVITHRVYRAPYQQGNEWYIQTKGDNPSVGVDNPIKLDTVEAKLITKTKFISVIYKAFSSDGGMIALIVVPFVLLLGSLIYRLVMQIKKPAKGEKVITEEYKQEVISEYLAKKQHEEDIKKKTIEEYLKGQGEKASSENLDKKTSDKGNTSSNVESDKVDESSNIELDKGHAHTSVESDKVDESSNIELDKGNDVADKPSTVESDKEDI